MRILFTGASSFSGLNLVQTLAGAGHEVITTFQRARSDYKGLRAERVALAAALSQPTFGLSFGDERFLECLAGEGPWDLLCHHGADVTDYKSASFDWQGALESNTRNLPEVLETFIHRGGQRVILTGTVFESDEGEGGPRREAVSRYGLSKALTAQVFRFEAHRRELALGKFVIPNPFGPYEDPRFTGYLIRTWKRGETATVSMPAYVRDNIHVSLLARAYRLFAEQDTSDAGAFSKLNPSGYAEAQGKFAQRFARELGPRLELDCELSLVPQDTFDEPQIRINTDILDADALGWNESQAWDELANYYRGRET